MLHLKISNNICLTSVCEIEFLNLVKLLSDLLTTQKKIATSDPKPPFVFHNYPLFRLLKQMVASPLINSYPMQMQKRSWMTTFVVFMLFSTCSHLHAHLHSLWFYVTAGLKMHGHFQYKIAQGSHVFLVKKYLTRGAYALMFALRWVVIFHSNFHYSF